MSRSILYACIARGPNILVENSLRSGNFFSIVYRILSSLSQDDQQMTYSFQGFVIINPRLASFLGTTFISKSTILSLIYACVLKKLEERFLISSSTTYAIFSTRLKIIFEKLAHLEQYCKRKWFDQFIYVFHGLL
jgi:hypothetical protein